MCRGNHCTARADAGNENVRRKEDADASHDEGHFAAEDIAERPASTSYRIRML